ncbi:hypothetical protein [Arthrobacter sp. EpRS71]|uniref:hypothetical protein n=1 Tax=Arthrobacter sp. EpRS71 TaxID=1743141 RepID=UPI0007463343|nr:hypothetical protein [Arthrobacter sp. EpRS71]KUM34890.1 hypothetical protein AR689_12395 [Arthrobacter sp. EpRS71]
MALGFVFMAIGLVWLPFREGIARRQYLVSSEILDRNSAFSKSDSLEADSELDEERIRGF